MKTINEGLRKAVRKFYRERSSRPVGININPEDLEEYASCLFHPIRYPIRLPEYKFNGIPLIPHGSMQRGRFGVLDSGYRDRCVKNALERALKWGWNYSGGAIPLDWLDREILGKEVLRLRAIINRRKK